MSSVAIHTHFSNFVEAIAAGDSAALTKLAEENVLRAEDASELIGRIALIAMRSDYEEHTVLTLSAASMLCRRLIALRHTLGEDSQEQTRGLPFVVQTLLAAAPAVRAGKDAPQAYPEPLFPSTLPEGETVSTAMQKAIHGRDAMTIERLLFGLYGTGADYRAISVRIYDGVSQTFQENGHAFLCAARGLQILDAAEWGEGTPFYLHWLAPHLALHEEEPDWITTVRDFLSESQHSLASYRTRLAAPRNEQALPLRSLLLSNASVPQICQGVFDALIKNGASARGIGSVLALAVSDLLQKIDNDDYELFLEVAHGLLYTSATRLIYTQVQEVEGLPQLFTAATYVNTLYKKLSEKNTQATATRPRPAGGGLIAPALLDSVDAHINAQDVAGALATARRYVQLGHDTAALFGAIGLTAAQADITADQGHTLQIVQAAGDEYLAWPQELGQGNAEGFLQVALRAAALARRRTLTNA
jgi:hypothetical protein